MSFPKVSRQRDITTKVETAVAAGHRPRKEKLLQGVDVGLVRTMIPSVKCLFRPGI